MANIPLVFFGNERLSTGATTTAPALRALIAAGYEVEAVIANHTDPVSPRGRDLEIADVARSFGVPLVLTSKDIPLSTQLKNYQAEAAILVAFGKIIPQEVIDTFPKGIINIHPSLLPELRGPTPVEGAILNGLGETGVSLMKIDSRMDKGPVYVRQKVSLTGSETKLELAAELSQIGADLLIKHLPDILSGKLQPTPQNDSLASYTNLIKKEDGVIDWTKPARQLEREIRAYEGWPKSSTELNGISCIVTGADAVALKGEPGVYKIENASLIVFAGEGAIAIKSIKPAGKKGMTVEEFLRGYRSRL